MKTPKLQVTCKCPDVFYAHKRTKDGPEKFRNESLKDTQCSSYLQFCNKSIGSDNVQCCHPKYLIRVVYSLLLKNFRCDWDGGVNLINPRDSIICQAS